MNPLLLLEPIDQLRRKLTDPASPLRPWWTHFLTLARQDPIFFSPWTIMAAVVTGEEQDRKLARQNFLRYVELGPEAMVAEDTHNHTHTASAPLGRWAIFYDWVADLGLFSSEEDAAIRATMLDHAYVFSLAQVQSRAARFDNQILSNAFACAAVGYVLGVRRGREPMGQRLMTAGVTWVEDVLRRLPEGGYSGEGSTYHEQVVLPLAMLASLLLRETTGRDVMSLGVAPDGRPVRELLETSFKMIGPTGLLPGWDHYGFQPATIRAGLALQARLSGDPAPLAVVRDLNLWTRLAHPAWEIDDRFWTLAWWPAELDAGAAAAPPYRPWLIPTVAGALQSRDTRTRIFQYWDECGGIKESGRLQVDPNALTLEALNSLILLDGYGEIPADMIAFPANSVLPYLGKRAIETVQEYIKSTWGNDISDERAAAMCLDGSVGLSNTLIFDDENWYVPIGPKSGRGQALHAAGPLQALRSDAASFYVDRYDVTRVSRASLLVDGRYALVCDRVEAKSPHRVTWQAFLRRPARQEGQAAIVETPEQVRCDVIPLQEGELTLRELPNYPRMQAGSVRLQHTPASAKTHRIDVALIPQSRLTNVEDLSSGWERTIGQRRDTVDLTFAGLSDPMDQPGAPRLFRRRFEVKGLDGRRRFLEIARAVSSLEVKVNGKPVAPLWVQARGTWEGSATFLPWVFDITDALVEGTNEVTLSAVLFHGESVEGPVRLGVRAEPLTPTVEREAQDAFRVTIDGKADRVLMDHEGGRVRWAGGWTDARFALLLASGEVAAGDATMLELPAGAGLPSGLTLHSQGPCDFAWRPERTTLARSSGAGMIALAWQGAHLGIDQGGCVNVTYHGDRPHRLTLELPLQRPVFVNGELIGRFGGPGSPAIDLYLPAAADEGAKGQAPASVAEVFRLAESRGIDAGEALVAALGSGDWRVRAAAADALGRLAHRPAVEVLLALFAQEEKTRSYPRLRRHWSWSKMLPIGHPGGPDPELPMPVGESRWRVKRAVVTALGKIGDPRAVAPLEAAMQRCDDFFTVTSQLAVALGRLGAPTSVPVLTRHLNHAEVNTKEHARLAVAVLTGAITRAQFEAAVGLS